LSRDAWEAAVRRAIRAGCACEELLWCMRARLVRPCTHASRQAHRDCCRQLLNCSHAPMVFSAPLATRIASTISFRGTCRQAGRKALAKLTNANGR